jgi:hypothetical protein
MHALPLDRPTAISFVADHDTHMAAAAEADGDADDDAIVASGLHPSSQS